MKRPLCIIFTCKILLFRDTRQHSTSFSAFVVKCVYHDQIYGLTVCTVLECNHVIADVVLQRATFDSSFHNTVLMFEARRVIGQRWALLELKEFLV